MTPEERALATHIGEQLIELCVERDEAIQAGNLDRVYELQAEIADASAQRLEIIHSSDAQ